MVFVFMERDNAGLSNEIATATVDNSTVVWDGDDAIKDWLYKQSFSSLDGKFDANNTEHWDALPELISGHMLWVVLREEAKKSILIIRKKGSAKSGNYGHQ